MVIRATVMMRPLPTLLIALFLTTSGAGPLCEIDCRMQHDVLRQSGALHKFIRGHCQETPAPSENGGRFPSNERPCGMGVHHPAALSTSASPRLAEPIAFLAVLPAGPEAVKAIPGAASGDQWLPRFLFIPLSESGSLPLRI